MSNYSKLDRPEVLSHIFFPRKEVKSPLPEKSYDFDCDVERDVTLGCRFHLSSPDAPIIIFFHGNAETVSDYDQVATKYTEFGMNILITTYRGYGWSTGEVTVTNMLSDANILLEKAKNWFEENEYTGKIFIMGRSLGSASAIDVTEQNMSAIKGLIIESGFGDTMPLTQTLGIDTEGSDITEADCFRNCEKIAEITIPTLILHGSRDTTIPPHYAEKLQACGGARAKQFLIIPGAEHNTMITTGGDLYFQTIKSFIDKSCGVTKWQYRRRKLK